MRQFMEVSDCCGAGIVSWGLCSVFQVVPEQFLLSVMWEMQLNVQV